MRLSAWARAAERGSPGPLRLMLWISLRFGWRAGQALLYPITLYFLLTSRRSRVASRDYLRRVLGRPVGFADVPRHFFTFACAILDRVYLLTGQERQFSIETEGVEAILAHLAAGRGCVLLGAHLGSFEALRVFARAAPVPVRAVMYRGDARPLTRLLEILDPDLAGTVIDIGQPGAMLTAGECLRLGGIVGFLADRVADPRKSVAIPFLGGLAVFSTGPLLLASMLDSPVMLFFGLRLGPRRYLLRFEPFATRIVLSRGSRAAELERLMAGFGARLEAVCRQHPFNWFNFFPFWGDSVDA